MGKFRKCGQMKILIIGSLHFSGSEKIAEQFKSACIEIGKTLARAGHTIVVGSDIQTSADRHVVEGVNTVRGKHTVMVYGPDRDETPFAADRVRLRNINFVFSRRPGSWAANRVHQILAADGVLIIGGKTGTAHIGYSAPLLGRPVVAVPSFGGTAADLWSEFLPDYQRVAKEHEGFGNLREIWDKSSAQVVLTLIEALIKQNPYKKASNAAKIFIPLTVLFFLGFWIWMFISPFDTKILSFILLLFTSALLGTGLRAGIIMFSDEFAQFSGYKLVAEGMVGLLVAFGLFLLYLSGGYTISGKVDFIKLVDNSDYVRVGSIMSIIGFSAGFLLERGVEKLRAGLEKTLSLSNRTRETGNRTIPGSRSESKHE